MKIFFASIFFALCITGCAGSGEQNRKTKIVEIESSLYPCYGEGLALCMQVKEEGKSYRLINGEIAGFNYTFGHTYMLEIEETPIVNPPQDGSSVARKLVRIVSKIEDEIGKEYKLQFSGDLTSVVTFDDQKYQLLGYGFNCLSAIDCSNLLELHSIFPPPKIQHNLFLKFQYAGNSELVLVAYGQLN
ncbi:MAG: hypothetical protein RL497_1636 [Pseudomonadota bacterium]|jgi:hypothetical protein